MPSTDDSATPESLLECVPSPDAIRRDPRVRVLALGLLLGFIAIPLFVYAGGWPLREASSTTFALGALVLGFAVISWTAAVMLGPAVELLQDYMDLASGWTEAGARQAFTILASFGAGVMVGSSVATLLV